MRHRFRSRVCVCGCFYARGRRGAGGAGEIAGRGSG